MIIGLTGPIGSGKSTVAHILKEQGALIIDADKLGHQVIAQSAPLRRRLAKAFGQDIFYRDGRLNRRRLATRAFAGPETKAQLDALVHPHLLRELRRQMKQARTAGKMAVVDAALLLDWHLDREVDLTLVVHAPERLRLSRLMAKGMAQTDAVARMKAQLPYAEFRRRADKVLRNDCSLGDLQRKVNNWYFRVVKNHHLTVDIRR